MIIRLTTPEAFDRLIDFLERERYLTWPKIKDCEDSFRDWFIAKAKKAMESEQVFLEVRWEYNPRTYRIEATAHYMALSEIDTDENFLKGQQDGE